MSTLINKYIGKGLSQTNDGDKPQRIGVINSQHMFGRINKKETFVQLGVSFLLEFLPTQASLCVFSGILSL